MAVNCAVYISHCTACILHLVVNGSVCEYNALPLTDRGGPKPTGTLTHTAPVQLFATRTRYFIHCRSQTETTDLGNSLNILQGIALEDSVVVNPPDALENDELVSVTGQNAAGAPGARETGNSKR
jgi:hypothetical protein